MAVTIVHDTTIVTADDAGAIHYDAALVVDDGRIAAIGPTAEVLARHPAAERVDGRGRAVLPGVIAAMGQNGPRIVNLKIAEPSLEDVFIHLTGKALRD